ncbi:MAG: hypothetical protein KGQ46_12365 [Hyphomicrobiales bacterium]|nr:hypothetical protein [Hyphomicrobiales bacterium]MDE2113846.1 hypothetical protein [Hyphomicrobiales bacterium]
MKAHLSAGCKAALALTGMVTLASPAAADSAAIFDGSHALPPIEIIGAYNPAITQGNISITICVPGFAKRQRPPRSLIARYKKKLLRRYNASHATRRSLKDFELDHLIPLELGGAPFDRRNLWLEPWHVEGRNGARRKDVFEGRLHRAVCAGKITLKAAQAAIAADWLQARAALRGEK